jgi:hypothetical protein
MIGICLRLKTYPSLREITKPRLELYTPSSTEKREDTAVSCSLANLVTSAPEARGKDMQSWLDLFDLLTKRTAYNDRNAFSISCGTHRRTGTAVQIARHPHPHFILIFLRTCHHHQTIFQTLAHHKRLNLLCFLLVPNTAHPAENLLFPQRPQSQGKPLCAFQGLSSSSRETSDFLEK